VSNSEQLTNIGYQVLRTFALTHRYNRWIIRMLKPYLGPDVLEVGSGIGNLTIYLKAGTHLTCMDKSRFFLQHLKLDFDDVELWHSDITSQQVAKDNRRFDSIVCINVLEHIEDDDTAVRNMATLLKPQGFLLIFVPALSCVYGEMDRQLGHVRRYDKIQLAQLLSRNGLIVKKIEYCNMIGSIGWWFNAVVLRKKGVSILQTILFDHFVPLVAEIETRIRVPFGMDLFCVARKEI